jgi:hypothetical protein
MKREFTPTTNVWVQKSAHLGEALGYVPATTIGSFIYTGGGATWDGTTLQDVTDAFRYDPVADMIQDIASIPRATSNTRAQNFNGKMWVMGGAFNSISNEVDVYDPMIDTWSLGPPFVTARRNFATDTDGISRIWLAGGYDSNVAPLASMEIFCAAGASPTPTPMTSPTATATATASPTATPTATATATATPTPTGTPSVTPRPVPTPRPRPTPAPRP